MPNRFHADDMKTLDRLQHLASNEGFAALLAERRAEFRDPYPGIAGLLSAELLAAVGIARSLERRLARTEQELAGHA